ncbi:hypothetical protein P9112_006391 [Eukaryota sp. TZLM1-RC]
MSESVSDSNGVKRKNDSQQDAQDVLSTSPPLRLLSSFLEKKNSDQEFLENYDENNVCSKQSHAPTDAQSVDNKDMMLEHAPMLEKIMWQILKQNVKENLLEEKSLRKNP